MCAGVLCECYTRFLATITDVSVCLFLCLFFSRNVTLAVTHTHSSISFRNNFQMDKLLIMNAKLYALSVCVRVCLIISQNKMNVFGMRNSGLNPYIIIFVLLFPKNSSFFHLRFFNERILSILKLNPKFLHILFPLEMNFFQPNTIHIFSVC